MRGVSVSRQVIRESCPPFVGERDARVAAEGKMTKSGLEKKVCRHLRNRARIRDKCRDSLTAHAGAHINNRTAQAEEFLGGAHAVDARNNAADRNLFEPIGNATMQLALLDIAGPRPMHMDILGNSAQHVPPKFPGTFNQ